MYWPCSFYDKRGRSCQNVKSRHDSKGHQNDKGKIIGTGRYESNFSPDAYSKDWIQLLKSQLISHEKELREKRSRSLRRKASEIEDALQLHQRHMDQFWSELRSASSFQSHATCFCCLMEIPQHPLPCGHVLCTGCVKAYGMPRKGCTSSILMENCPLHKQETEDKRPWTIRFKPDFAGVRLLALDG